MMKAGILLDLAGAVIISAVVITLVPRILGSYMPG
jgi:hydrogenase-4 membrane subunit HyfE